VDLLQQGTRSDVQVGVRLMKLIEKHHQWYIVPSDGEMFFAWEAIDAEVPTHIRANPRILPFLAEWMDNTCPGRWGTAWMDKGRAIWIEDPSVFQLFKLAWHDHADIQIVVMPEITAFYCPYIPLTITSAIPQVGDGEEA